MRACRDAYDVVQPVLSNGLLENTELGIELCTVVVTSEVEANEYANISLVGCCKYVWQGAFDGVSPRRVEISGDFFDTGKGVSPVLLLLEWLGLTALPCSNGEAPVDLRLLWWM